ncbi:hypothetical protein ACFLZW_00900 [Chloroflexota bacterium]
MSEKRTASVRPLYAWEIQEARIVFADGLRYQQVRIHENVKWPNRINRIGMFLKRMPYVEVNNAITLGNHIHFPIQILKEKAPVGHPEHYKLDWLIHELTHAWQYQHLGWKYLWMAINAQIREGKNAYDFGGVKGLKERYNKGLKLSDYNLEQQGDIARSYYLAICHGKDTSPWLPFITELQNPPER